MRFAEMSQMVVNRGFDNVVCELGCQESSHRAHQRTLHGNAVSQSYAVEFVFV